MQIEVFTLCDAATDNFGKLNILGSFDTILANQVPLTYPHCAIAIRIRFSAIESGEHKVSVNFIDLDGRHIIQPASGSLAVVLPSGRKSVASNMILNMQGLKLEKYGEYSIDLAIDGKCEASVPLFVVAKNIKDAV